MREGGDANVLQRKLHRRGGRAFPVAVGVLRRRYVGELSAEAAGAGTLRVALQYGCFYGRSLFDGRRGAARKAWTGRIGVESSKTTGTTPHGSTAHVLQV